jgi:hypothetical protein
MEKIIENIIRKVIFKKFPTLIDVHVSDMYKGSSHMKQGHYYNCQMKTDKCLDISEMNEIENEIKMLFKMMSDLPDAKISSSFDCGDGNGYRSVLSIQLGF